jgi:hypothetical protein
VVPRDVDAGQIPLALSVLQILALDIGTDLLPPLALGAEPPEPGVMERPPRTRSARSLDGAVLARAVGFPGPVDAVVSLAMVPVGPALLLGWRPGVPCRPGGRRWPPCRRWCSPPSCWPRWPTPFEGRSTVTSLRVLGQATNRLLVGVVAVEFLALLGFVYLGRCRSCSATNRVTPVQWVPVLAAPLLLLAAEATREAVARRRQWAVAGPISLEPPGHETLRRRAAVV